MSPFSPDALWSALRALGVADGAALCVALSGGLDSTVLLHALARIAREQPHLKLRAVHVDHQLQTDSARWRAHCEAAAAALGAPLTSICVRIDAGEEGLEAAARRARYDALRALLAPGEALLTAHHADDQLETVLLALLRGAGVTGLSGVIADQPFGRGRLLRPLLGFTREALETWARAAGLVWVEDPSNENTALDRNFLRRRVAPLLRERWPAAARSATRSAAHLHEAGRLLAELAHADLARVAAEECIDVAQLAALDPPRRRNALRCWIRERGARAPSTRRLLAVERELLTARADRTPCVQWDDVELRRYRGRLYLDRRRRGAQPLGAVAWQTSSTLELPAGLGRLRLHADQAGGLSAAKLAPTLTVRFRRGGEQLRIAGEPHRRRLKKMLQAAGVPPWRRDRLPLIYSGDRLVAVGDLWVADEFAARDGEHAVRIAWERTALSAHRFLRYTALPS